MTHYWPEAWLNQWYKLLMAEIKEHGLERIIKYGASNPEQYEYCGFESIPSSVVWSFLVWHDDACISNTKREAYLESPYARADIEWLWQCVVDDIWTKVLDDWCADEY